MTIVTGHDNIQAVRLLSLRGMLRLEKAGLKTRGGALRPRIAKEFGLSPRASYCTYIAAISVILEQYKGV